MKLAELLIIRKAEKKNLDFLESRLKNNVRVQEGDTPQEQPDALLLEIYASVERIQQYTAQISKANHSVTMSNGGLLIESLIERDALARKRKILASAIEKMANKEPRFGRMEVKYVDVANHAIMVEKLQVVNHQYLQLESLIQKKNWEVEV